MSNTNKIDLDLFLLKGKKKYIKTIIYQDSKSIKNETNQR